MPSSVGKRDREAARYEQRMEKTMVEKKQVDPREQRIKELEADFLVVDEELREAANPKVGEVLRDADAIRHQRDALAQEMREIRLVLGAEKERAYAENFRAAKQAGKAYAFDTSKEGLLP